MDTLSTAGHISVPPTTETSEPPASFGGFGRPFTFRTPGTAPPVPVAAVQPPCRPPPPAVSSSPPGPQSGGAVPGPLSEPLLRRTMQDDDAVLAMRRFMKVVSRQLADLEVQQRLTNERLAALLGPERRAGRGRLETAVARLQHLAALAARAFAASRTAQGAYHWASAKATRRTATEVLCRMAQAVSHGRVLLPDAAALSRRSLALLAAGSAATLDLGRSAAVAFVALAVRFAALVIRLRGSWR